MIKNSRRWSIVKENVLKAVHDDDLISLVTSLNVYDDIINGKKKCVFCQKTISLDNIDALLPCEDQVEFSCNFPKCHLKLIGLGEKDESDRC
jgi:hypothetical protein